MPPLVSGSDAESDGDIPFRAADPVVEGDEGDEEEGGDEYVIEVIEDHTWDDETGEVLYKVKWEGWDNEEDRTFEPEDNLETARDSLESYWKTLPNGKKPANRAPKGSSKKRKATDTPKSRNAKKGRSETPETASKSKRKGGNTVVKDEFKLPKGSWEDSVASIDTIEEALDEKGAMQRFVYVMWENGTKTRHQLATVNEKCPQKMLRYYESHLVFRRADADTNGGA